MEIITKKFGKIVIDKNKIILFPEGILGFEKFKKYILIEEQKESMFKWLQCIDNPDLTFLIIEPEIFKINYTLDISDKDVEFLKIEKPEDVEIFAIVNVPENPMKMTANLQGPIVINLRKKLAKQVISTDPTHKVKHYIIEEMQENTARYLQSKQNNKTGDTD